MSAVLERDQCACFFYRVQLTKSVPAIMRAMALRVAFTSCQISYSKAIPPPLPPPLPPHPPASRHPPCPHRHPRTSSLLMRYVSHHKLAAFLGLDQHCLGASLQRSPSQKPSLPSSPLLLCHLPSSPIPSNMFRSAYKSLTLDGLISPQTCQFTVYFFLDKYSCMACFILFVFFK